MTRKDIDQFWSRLTQGTRVTCLSNTYIPDRAGTTGTITKPGKSTMRVTTDDGKHYWISPPKNVRDYVSIEGNAITYRISDLDHYATWAIQ